MPTKTIQALILISLASLILAVSPPDNDSGNGLWAKRTIPRYTASPDILARVPIAIKDKLSEKAFCESLEIALVEVSAKRLSVSYLGANQRDVRIAALMEHLEGAARKLGLPVGFYLVSLADGIDESQVRDKMVVPVLGFSAAKSLVEAGSVILMPDFEAMLGYQELIEQMEAGKRRFPWSSKVPKAFWRGATTGLLERENCDSVWELPRVQLVRYCANNPDICDGGFTTYLQAAKNNQTFQKTYPLANWTSPQDSLQFKYLVLADGNAATFSRMAWALLSNSIVVKLRSSQIQWYYRFLEEGVTHLEIDSLDELRSLVESCPSEIQRVVEKSSSLAVKLFRNEEVLKATHNAFHNYARAVDQDSHQISFLHGNEKSMTAAAHRDRHGVFASLTTSPKRLSNIWQVLERIDYSLLNAVYLNIPWVFPRTGERFDDDILKDLEERFPKLKVNRVEEDIGPATKIIPALEDVSDKEAVVISIDDDYRYPYHLVEEIAYRVIRHDLPISTSGQDLPYWGIDPRKYPARPRPPVPPSPDLSHRDVIEGFSSIGYKPKFLDSALVRNLIDLDKRCRYSDDVVLSYAMAHNSFPPMMLNAVDLNLDMTRPFQYGFREDALHRGSGITSSYSGPDYNHQKYGGCVAEIVSYMGSQ